MVGEIGIGHSGRSERIEDSERQSTRWTLVYVGFWNRENSRQTGRRENAEEGNLSRGDKGEEHSTCKRIQEKEKAN